MLYAANRGADPRPGHISVFDMSNGRIAGKIPVDVSPYDLQFNADGSILYVSNWSSDNIAVVDVSAGKVIATIPTGHNPNDLELGSDSACMSQTKMRTPSP